MIKNFGLALFVCLLLLACKEKSTYVKVTTDFGDMVFRLYDETPKHRDNFIKLANEEYFKDLLFHRVMDDFMIQGGDPESRGAKPGVLLGNGGPDYAIPQEFVDSLYHRKGVLAAAREPDEINPDKESSASQFYIVEGQTWEDEDFPRFERRIGKDIPEEHRTIYKTIGGTPFLDNQYTVFGEMVAGFNVLEAIASVRVDRNNRPVEDVSMDIEVIKWKARKKSQ